MRSYAKLAAFIAVLLLSVSLMSTAIEYLGELSRVDLDMELQAQASGEGDEGDVSKEDKTVKVKGALPGEGRPLFEIWGSPWTKYLRWTVSDIYVNGTWDLSSDHPFETYSGEPIEVGASGYSYINPVELEIKPLFNLTTFIPVPKAMIGAGFSTTVERYPDMDMFTIIEPFDDLFNLTYASYGFSNETLREAALRPDSYLQMPEGLKERLVGIAEYVVEGHTSPYDKLKAIENYLRETFEYTNEFTEPPDGMDPIQWFLLNDLKGNCRHFNTAFVLLTRSLGIPARVVTGFLIVPEMSYQLVMPRRAHMWAEVPFDELGWIRFDATPENLEQSLSGRPMIPTVTEILYNDDTAVKGNLFGVFGMVTTYNGSLVEGPMVEIYLTLNKSEKGTLCGQGTVTTGIFDITCTADPSLLVGDYHLVAHTLPYEAYEESWSDPPIRIMAETESELTAPKNAYVGDEVTIRGQLLDRSNDKPVVNATVMVQLEGEAVNLTTNEDGMISLSYDFSFEGEKNVTMTMEDSDYYLGSNTSFGISVSIRPQPQPSLLEMMTMFPYNVILMVGGGALVIGGVVMLSRRPKGTLILRGEDEEEPQEEELDLDSPITFDDYKDGVVKQFNRFYATYKRRFKEVTESMTPREFQHVMLTKITPNGASALEYLVTAFEIADYSTSRPTKEMYEKCVKAIEVLNGLIRDE